MSSVDEKNSVKSKSNFNFFAILEDTISGVIEFVIRFIGITLLCLFRPKLCIARYRQAEELPVGIFPRPYTYLVICIFSFIKGLYWISQTTPAGLNNSIHDETVLVKIHGLVENLGEISTLQIILSVFPTIAVILFLSLIITLLHKPFSKVTYRETSHAFSYVFGAQAIGVLILFVVFTVSIEQNLFGSGDAIATISFMLGAIMLIIVSTIFLRAWYGVNVKHISSKFGLYFLYFFLSIGIAIVYFSTISGAYTKLETNESKSIASQNISTGDTTSHVDKINVTVYHIQSDNNHLIFSLLLQNNSNIPYYLHGKGSAMIMNILPTDLSKMISSNDQAEKNLELLHEYLELMNAGYARVDLTLVEKLSEGEHLIRPGQQQLVTFDGPISEKIILNQIFSWIIRIPVAGFNPDGTLTYTSIGEDIGSSTRDIYKNLDKEKMKTDKEIDETVDELQKVFEQTRQEIKRLIEQDEATNIDP